MSELFSDTADGQVSAQHAAPVSAADAEEFSFVSLPDGRIIAVPKASIVPVTTEKQDEFATNLVPEMPQHYYVHLANGDIIRVDSADVPAKGGAGSSSYHGHWVKNGECHTIIGVYPVETAVKG